MKRLMRRIRGHCASPSRASPGSGGTTVRCGLAGRCSISQTFSRTSRVASSASASPACTASARAWMVRYSGDLGPVLPRAPAAARAARRAGSGCCGRRSPARRCRAPAACSGISRPSPWTSRSPRPPVPRWCPPARRAAPAGPEHRRGGCPRAAGRRPAARDWRPRGRPLAGGPGCGQPRPHLAHARRRRFGSMLLASMTPGSVRDQSRAGRARRVPLRASTMRLQ